MIISKKSCIKNQNGLRKKLELFMTRITDTTVAVCYLESIINQVQIPKFGFQIRIRYMMTIKMWIELKFLAV